jgi:hypothetical protein
MSVENISVKDYSSYLDMNKYIDEKSAAVVSLPGFNGISGWVFDVPTGEEITLSADVTDHPTENGSFISDHVVVKPVMVTLSGYVGNLVYRSPQPGSVEYVADQITSKLLAVNAYLGPLTQGATQKAAAITSQVSYIANQVNAIKKKATNVINFLKGAEKEPDPQTIAYHELKALWKSKQIVSLQTYWEFFGTMVITNISARHDESTDDYTDISITLKEIRLVDVETTEVQDDLFPAANTQQEAAEIDKGKIGGKEEQQSLLYYGLYGQ